MREREHNPGAVEKAHAAVLDSLFEGAVALDATAGNGHDTSFLARSVGAAGKVYALDVQSEAVTRTRARLEAEGLIDRVILRQGSHGDLRGVWPELRPGSVQAIMFNLGYLPGGDKSLITRPESTLAGLGQSLSLIAGSGVLTVVCYPGHPGGEAESEAVCAWAEGLPEQTFSCRIERPDDRSATAPFLVRVRRRCSIEDGSRSW
jgi:hypothetical protein